MTNVEGYCYDAELVSAVESRQHSLTPEENVTEDSHKISNVLQRYIVASGWYYEYTQDKDLFKPIPEEAQRLATELKEWVQRGKGHDHGPNPSSG